MTSPETPRIAARDDNLTRRALLGAVPVLLIIGVRTVWAQHEGHNMTQHGGHTTATDSTQRMRAAAAEQRAWLGVRLAFIGIGLALYFAWWRYQVVMERRARLREKEGRTTSRPIDEPRPLPRQRRRR